MSIHGRPQHQGTVPQPGADLIKMLSVINKVEEAEAGIFGM